MVTPYNRDGNARRKNRIDALKEIVLQQSLVVFGFFIYKFRYAQPQENEPILP